MSNSDISDIGKIFIYGEEEKLENAKAGINGIIQKVAVEQMVIIQRDIFNDPDDSEIRKIRSYLELGGKLRKSVETESFIQLVNAMQHRENPFPEHSLDFEDVAFDRTDGRVPFIFVCASSGAGKTQLPFSLDIPLFYFLFNSSLTKLLDAHNNDTKVQRIYRSYLQLSSYLMKCIDYDCEILREKEAKSGYTTEGRQPWDIHIGSDVELFLPGFILALYNELTRIRESNEKFGSEPWIMSQLRITECSVKKISINTARKEFERICKGKKNLPILFFDESQKNKDETEAIFARRYVYLRRCTSALGLIAVFMGTNASLANFVNFNLASSSRAESSNIYPWCYIVHRLASVTREYIDESVIQLRECIHSRFKENPMIVSTLNRFMDVISKSITKERPLFCQFIFEYLNDRISSMETPDIIEMIESIPEKLFKEFTGRKIKFPAFNDSDCINYNYSNISLALPEYWVGVDMKRKIGMEDGTDRMRDVDFEKTSGVHNHIAYLYVPKIILERLGNLNYFGVYVSRTSFSILGGIARNRIAQFCKDQIFALFKEETFGELGFIGSKNYLNVFVQRVSESVYSSRIARISARQAVESMWSSNKVMPSTYKSSKWNVFEASVSLSILVASHCNGFAGSRFSEWFRHFLREMSRDGQYGVENKEEGLPLVEYPADKFWNELVVPMCSSSVSAEWNDELARYVSGECGGNIGVLYADLGQASRDFYIRRYGSDKTMISGECKCYEEGIGVGLVRESMERLTRFGSAVSLVVANGVKNIKNWSDAVIVNGIKVIPGDVLIYVLRRGNNGYIVEPCYSSGTESGDVKRFVIVDANIL